ncbi:hypothetical protein E1B28_007747 [Marasmius oreades]|uniref:BTB domain-containing protein n=1 Tax=Marasmius oreades TaxID=181124 RepID=A0A9P7S2Y4_9AGAR|nr:uncharacterized protein E1B28_007747 [Marasmius oreades]KAG7094135.1 hypothetical protein E1B28_007747 [Marasmius oreades]
MEVDPPPLVSPLFNDAKADVILRTVGVDFRMYKSLLSLASPFFDGMFTLPQPTSKSSRAVEKLLMFCHPAHSPVLETLDEVRLVIEPAVKYDMAGVVQRIVMQFAKFIDQAPLRAYCIAWQFKLRDQVQQAAEHLLKQPLLPRRFVKELDLIPATALHRLHEYHYSCGKAARAVATAFGWIDVSSYIRFEAGPVCYSCSNGGETVTGYDNQSISARSWWVEYMRETAVLLQERPCGATVKDPELLNKTFRRAVQCRDCKDRVLMEMQEFTGDFASEVERTTAMITLDIDF